MNHVISGVIRIGTFTSVSVQWLPKIIRSFQTKYPLVKFELLDGTYANITDWITQGKIDCGFLTAPIPEELSFIPLMKDPMMVLMCKNHPLAIRLYLP
ncbi:LysR family transcriptional regulator substrate-binding protein [Bariatricus sp. SGI.154]|uniref:LysR family transcriptional regulator substrate-binding protein n=1 Tax=Bariatricus sp. SGI.154 TaxID=3420549 RepID=UPI003D05FA4C